jgi:hypothetical protein
MGADLMPDVVATPNPLVDYGDGWANVSVPAGVTSLRAAKGLPPRPRRVPQRDPSRKRVKCAACWQEGTETRPNDVTGTPILLCPDHVLEWDADAVPAIPATPDALGSPRTGDAPEVASVSAVRAIVESAPTLAPQPNPEVAQGTTRRSDATRNAFEAAGYHSRALAHGARRAELPSRSKEARREEKRRQRARARERAAAAAKAAE